MPASDLSLSLAKKIKIVNPIENGSNITSRKRALQFVEAKRAIFVGKDLLRFIEADSRNQAAAQRAARGYTSVNRMMTRTEIENIPLARAAMAVREAITDRSRNRVRRSAGGRSGPVRALISDDGSPDRVK